ncbi:MAG: protein kinase domain-containing protein [Ardenticatenaceae bacterium]
MTTTQFGRYLIQREVGRGGMASVYLAYDPSFERYVALKVLPHHFLHDPTFRQGFAREAKIIAQLEHEAITPVYDYGEHNSQPYIAMRLMRGGSLEDRLANGPLLLAETHHILQRMCAALDKAHANKIIHRDLKPANVLFDEDGKAHLADFGIARLTEGTQTSSFAGTFNYMAPEQGDGTALDARTDIYQTGVVLFEMLTGQLPFKGDNPVTLLHQHAYAPIPSVQAYNPTLPAGCDAVLARAMAKNPADRFASGIQFARAFADVIHTQNEPANTTTPTTQPAWSKAFVGVLIVGVTGLLGLMIFGLVISFQQKPSPEAFTDDTIGVLLASLETNPSESTLITNTKNNLQTVLAKTGVGDQVEVREILIESGESLAKLSDAQKARMTILISVSEKSEKEDTFTIVPQYQLPDPASPYAQFLHSTAEALVLPPVEHTSIQEASTILADRLGATVNAVIGTDARRDGNYDECSRRFSAVLSLLEQIDLSFNRAEASHTSLAICLDAQSSPEEAKAHYEQAIEINPDYARAYFGLGNYWYSKRNYEQATQYYQDTLKKSEIDPLSSNVVVGRAYAGLGNIDLVNSEFEKAIDAFSQAIEQDPQFPAHYLARANPEIGLGMQEEAKADLESCINLARTGEPIQSDYFKEVEKQCKKILDSLGTP